MSGQWAASALDWWREAGVDTILDEAPRDWLNPRAAAPAPAPAEAAASAEPLPDTLDAFRTWLMTAAIPGIAPGTPRIAPAGDPAAGLMVMVDMPGAEDLAAGRLLAGAAGELFDRMMAAIGRGRDSLYLASLSPARTPTGALAAATAAALADPARRHVGLARPKALLLFGDACARALLGSAVVGARGRWHELATPAGPVRALATMKPEKLLGQPSLKKHAWEDLQLLMEGLKP